MEDLVIISKEPKRKNLTVFFGFPGSGLVGNISIQYLIDAAKYKLIGNITGAEIPPVAMMVNGVIIPPIRIYEKGSSLVFISDIVIPPQFCYQLTNTMLDWLEKYGVKEIVAIAGLVTSTGEKRVFGVTTTEDRAKVLMKETGVDVLPMGSISGMAGSLLLESRIRGIGATCYLGESVNVTDPRSAVSVLTALNDIYKLKIDIQPLIEQEDEIESSFQRLNEQMMEAERDKDTERMKHESLPMYG